jgi:hypothetical protein
MAPDTVPPVPGGMTVPPLFGWEHVLVAVAVAVVLAVAALVLLAAGTAARQRAEWQAWLDGRAAGRREE